MNCVTTSAAIWTSSGFLALRWTHRDANTTAARSGRVGCEAAHFARDQFAVGALPLQENIRRPVLDDLATLQHHHAIEIAQRRPAMADRNHGSPAHQPGPRLAARILLSVFGCAGCIVLILVSRVT